MMIHFHTGFEKGYLLKFQLTMTIKLEKNALTENTTITYGDMNAIASQMVGNSGIFSTWLRTTNTQNNLHCCEGNLFTKGKWYEKRFHDVT